MPTFSQEPDGSLSELTRQAIANHLYELAEEYSVETFPAENRNHLGVSIIGHPCSRHLWYMFRWVKLEQFPARIRRLFDKGHLAEKRFFDILSWMGFFVRDIDPTTNKQYKFSAVEGHYGGSGDSVMLLPWFREEKDRILAEYKTHNKKSFEKLKKDGLKLSKPQHYSQMCGYGKAFKLRYGLYCAVNKDDDDLHFEFIELDWNHAQQLENKARDIIAAKFPPEKISPNPAYFECTYCSHRGICHYNEPVEINCRSCKMATAVANAEWHCSRFNAIIPKNFLVKGCDQHVSVNT